MTALWIWLLVALGLPLVGQWIAQRPGSRVVGPFHPLSLLLFFSCLLIWILLAREFSAHQEQSSRLLWFGAICALGLIWVESILVLLPGRGRLRRKPLSEPPSPTDSELPHHEMTAEDSGDELPELSPEAEALWGRISVFDTMQVHTIMTPGRDVRTIGADATAAQALAQMRESGRTRLVVIDGSLERIVGIAHAKDLAPLLLTGQEEDTIRQHHRRLRRVSERQTLTQLIEQFRSNRATAGVVIDLRGRTLGLITLGDVFRYVSGGEGPSS